ncbi:MAG: hypothetical protein PHD48_04865 [Alphaproteobacteria bacterium]|nr:hypothetical protein [Alphaproteobacteria bacterium]
MDEKSKTSIKCDKCGRTIPLKNKNNLDNVEEDLSNMLLEKGLITSHQLESVIEEKNKCKLEGKSKSLANLLLQKHFITRTQLKELLGKDDSATIAIKGYTIVGKLGGGGMGSVYKAVHDMSGMEVAIKVLSGRLSKKKGFLARFMREAHGAIELDHPNIRHYPTIRHA